MKNKIRCLFDKITSEDLLGIFGICICALLIFTMVFAPISASAADHDSNMILKAGTYIFNNPLAIGDTESLGAEISFTSKIVDAENNVDINISCTVMSIVGSNAEGNDFRLPVVVYGGITSDVVIPDDYMFEGVALTYIDEFTFESFRSVTFATDQTVDDAFGNWFIANTNYNEVNGGSPSECPTLEEQISNYNGTWTDFLMLLRQNNRTLADSYQYNIDLAIQSGYQSGANSVTLEQRLSEFDGDWQDFERLMAEYNVDLQTMYTYYVNSLETQSFEDGKDYGQEVGYKEGYNSGLNKGQSDTFTKNFFTDFLGGVVEAIDSIHLYEHIRQIDGGVSTVVEWYISPWTIFTSMICLIVVIIILKVWLGG